MTNSIISFSIKNKFIVSFFVLVIVGWGVYSMFNLPIDAVPDITNNQVQVMTISPSLATQEVEQFITRPVELSMANLPGVIEIRSISRFGLSVVTIVFEESMGTYLPRQLVAEKIKEAEEQIPSELGTPELGPITTGLGEIYQYLVIPKPGYEEKYDITELRTIQDWIIKRQLAGIPGVVEINSWGGKLKQYEVAVKPERLSAMDISTLEIFDALEKNNENTGASYIEKTNTLYFIRGEGIIKSLEDIKLIVIKNTNGIPVTIGDVADVAIGSPKRFGATTYNGKGETVSGIIMMLKGENSAEVVKKVKQRIEKIESSLPEGVEIKPYIDRTKLVNNTTNTIIENLTFGGLIVVFVLVLLLGNLRSGLVVASIIPLSMLFALGMMNIFGVSANLMSLGALDFGIIVDGSVIIVEFIIANIILQANELKKLSGKDVGLKINTIVNHSSFTMMNSAFFGQMIILIVFVPILTLTGIEGKMFRPMAFTFGFAVIGAMILCFTYIPMISSFAFRNGVGEENRISKSIMVFLQRIYLPVINFSLRKKKIIILSSGILLAITVIVFLNLGGEFIPQLEEGDFALETRAAPGTSLSQTIKSMTEVEKILVAEFPEVIDVVTKIGAGDIPTDPMPIEGSDIMIHLKPKDEWVTAKTKEELFEKMEEALEVLPGINTEFSQPIEMRFNELMTGIKQDIAVKIFGENLNMLQQKAIEASKIINRIQGTSDVKIEQVVGLPQLNVKFDREKLARYGLNIQELNKMLRASFSGEKAGVIYENERSFDLVVRLESKYRDDIESINGLYIKLDNGEQVPLKELAQIRFDTGPAQISRDNTYRRIVIGVNARDRDTESLVAEMKEELNSKLKLPPGYSITFGGEFENLQKAKDRLYVVVPVVLLVIFLILYISLNSVIQALLIYTAIPFAVVGGVFALLFRGMPYSISAGIGFIALFGVAVLNGLVLINSFNSLKNKGLNDIREIIITGTTSRLRPVIMTAAVAAMGFLPMAISTSSGAEVQRPLASVVIGGLITSTLLTLVVLPVLYSIFETKRQKHINGN